MGKLKTKWIEDQAVTSAKIATSAVSSGLLGGGGTALQLDPAYNRTYPTLAGTTDWSGHQALVTITANTQGFGNALTLNASFQWVDAQADAEDTVPCFALAMETGTGASKIILLEGMVRNTAWNWSRGLIWVSDTAAGGLTQTRPTDSGEQVTPAGFAVDADTFFFRPSWTVVGLV